MLTSCGLIQPSSSSRRRAKYLSSWSKGWLAGSERWTLFFVQTDFDLCSKRLCSSDSSTCWMLAEMVAITSIKVRLTIVRSCQGIRWFFVMCFFLLTEKFFVIFFYWPRSSWLQRRRWGIQRWVKSVAGGKPRRHGTQCSWEHIFYFNQYQLWFNSSFWFYKPTFWRQFSLRPDSFLPCCRWTISSLESHTLKAVFFLHNFSIRYL